MNAPKFSRIKSVFLAGLALVVLVCGCTSQARSDSGSKEAAVARTAPNPETLVVYSFPSNLETYVTPKDKLSGSGMDVIYLTSSEYLVGRTPLEIELEPGEYRVTVKNFDDPIDFRLDGEASVIRTLTEKGLQRGGKSYSVSKQSGHQAIVSALFWPEGQSLDEFVASLPGDVLFEVSDVAGFEGILQEHGVPKGDWTNLLSMLQRTGKAVWHGQDPADPLVVYFAEPGLLAVHSTSGD